MNFELTQEQEMIQEMAATIAEEEFADDAFSWDGEFP